MKEIRDMKDWNETRSTFYTPWKKLVAQGVGVKVDGKMTIKVKK